MADNTSWQIMDIVLYLCYNCYYYAAPGLCSCRSGLVGEIAVSSDGRAT